jgi:hypothetical protein
MRPQESIGLIFIYFAIATYTYSLLSVLYPGFGVNIYDLINDYSEEIPNLFYLYLLMLISFFSGWKLAIPSKAKLNQYKVSFLKVKNIKRSKTSALSILTLFILSVFLLYLTYGWGFLLREVYHPGEANYLYLSIYKLLTLWLIISTYFNSKFQFNSKLSILTIIIVVSLSIASRISVFYIGLILILYVFFSDVVKIRNIILLMVVALFILVFLQYTRGLDEQGLVGIYRHVDFTEVLDMLSFSMFYAFGFNTFITAATISEYSMYAKFSDFLTMINPLPGFMTDWYSIAPNMTVSKAVPFNSIGIIFSFGVFFTTIFYFFLGVVIGWLDGFIQFVKSKSKILSIVIWSLLVIFVLLHFQFTLRSSLRFVYYAIFIVANFYFFSMIQDLYKNKT